MKLNSLAALTADTSAHRGSPCAEFPGKWIVYVNGVQVAEFIEDPTSHISAAQFALQKAYQENDYTSKISVCWCASDDDPRQGKVWFTGFYAAHVFNKRSYI